MESHAHPIQATALVVIYVMLWVVFAWVLS